MATLTSTVASNCSTSLPEYVVFKKDQTCPPTLRSVVQPLTIPFGEQDKIDIETLSCKFDSEKKAYGLAAIQIGIPKRIIVFRAVRDQQTEILRPDLTDTMPKTLWVNPRYVGIEEAGFNTDYEACFSVEGVAGKVRRYKKINYEAYTTEGIFITGTVEGFLARLIQHEIDHLDGILFTDIADEIMPMTEYYRMRDEAIERGYR